MASRITEQDSSHLVRLSAGLVHYNDVGEGPPLIFTIGYAPGASGWLVYHRALDMLSKHFRCLLIDPPGSSKGDPHVIRGEARSELYARTIREFMDALGLESASLVDMSFGGQTGQVFALKWPTRLDKLILHACGLRMPPIFWNGPSDAHQALQNAFSDPTLVTMRRMMDLYLHDGAAYSDEQLMLRERLNAWLSRPELEEARRASENIALSLEHRLHEIAAPSLLLFGRNDRVMGSPEGALILLNYLRDARLIILNRCGHWIPFERPEEFARLVSGFVQHAQAHA